MIGVVPLKRKKKEVTLFELKSSQSKGIQGSLKCVFHEF